MAASLLHPTVSLNYVENQRARADDAESTRFAGIKRSSEAGQRPGRARAERVRRTTTKMIKEKATTTTNTQPFYLLFLLEITVLFLRI